MHRASEPSVHNRSCTPPLVSFLFSFSHEIIVAPIPSVLALAASHFVLLSECKKPERGWNSKLYWLSYDDW